MPITADYQKFMAEAAREALRALVVNNPSTSVGDLRELLAENPSLGGLTLAELVGDGEAKAAAPRRGRPPKAGKVAKESKKPAAPAEKRAGSHKQWETRTEEGRAALDRAVLETLAAFGGVGVSAEAIRARLGATPAQIRTSLNRHIESGEVSFSGKARGTRYSLEAE